MDRVLYGLQVTGIGLVVVFLGLTILIICISLMAAIFKHFNEKKAAKAAAAQAASAPAVPEPAPMVEETPASEDVTDPELIAVIAAALAAFDNSGRQMVVRKVRRVSGWKNSARAEQVYRF